MVSASDDQGRKTTIESTSADAAAALVGGYTATARSRDPHDGQGLSSGRSLRSALHCEHWIIDGRESTAAPSGHGQAGPSPHHAFLTQTTAIPADLRGLSRTRIPAPSRAFADRCRSRLGSESDSGSVSPGSNPGGPANMDRARRDELIARYREGL